MKQQGQDRPPRVQDERGTRERLIKSAAQEFAAKGLAGARVSEIAKRADINKQAVYHYFGSKERLYVETLEYVILSVREKDAQFNVGDLDPVDALRAFTELVIQTSLADPTYQRLLIDANWYGDRYITQITNPMVTQVSSRIRLLASILERGAAVGAFREGLDPIEVYMSILGVLSLRQTNAHTLSHTLGVDLLSADGRARSRRAALEHITAGLVV